ncbi:uncharacterized protein [Antedon mediterranea]|uniref:uncharacterized protein isoform X2 n=1 Tax=Antedon mediterranea TaxID=105859 RepID=UPI003AF414B3
MSESVYIPCNYWSFVQKVVDSQVWKPIEDTLDSRLKTIVQRTEETQKRIETTTLSDLLSRICNNGDSQDAASCSSVFSSLSSDCHSQEETESYSPIDYNNSSDKDNDVTSTTSNDTVDTINTVLTEHDIVPSPSGPDNRYQQDRPLRSWKKIHAVFLNRRRRRFCDRGSPRSETSSSSVEWCSLEESMEKEGLLRGPFEIDFVKPQYENAYIRSTCDQEEAETVSKAKKKVDLSKLIAEYDRQNTNFLIKIPTDMSPNIPKTKLNYYGKRPKSPSGSPGTINVIVDQNIKLESVRKSPPKLLDKEIKNTELEIHVTEPPMGLKVNLENFVIAKPFVPGNAKQQLEITQIENNGKDNTGEITENHNVAVNELLDNAIHLENKMTNEKHEEQPKTKLTAMAKEFVPRNVTTDVAASSNLTEEKQDVPSFFQDSRNLQKREDPKLSEIFNSACKFNDSALLNENKDIDHTQLNGPVTTKQAVESDFSHQQQCPEPDKRCGTLGQTVTDHTQPLPRIGLQPPSGLAQLNRHHQPIISAHQPVYRGGGPTIQNISTTQQQVHNQYMFQMHANNNSMFYHQQAQMQQENQDYVAFMHAIYQQHHLEMTNRQQAGNVSRMQDPNLLHPYHNHLMYQMMAGGVSQVQPNAEQSQLLQYQEQLARNIANAHQPPQSTIPPLQPPQSTVPRPTASLMDRFKSPSMVPEFIPRNK